MGCCCSCCCDCCCGGKHTDTEEAPAPCGLHGFNDRFGIEPIQSASSPSKRRSRTAFMGVVRALPKCCPEEEHQLLGRRVIVEEDPCHVTIVHDEQQLVVVKRNSVLLELNAPSKTLAVLRAESALVRPQNPDASAVPPFVGTMYHSGSKCITASLSEDAPKSLQERQAVYVEELTENGVSVFLDDVEYFVVALSAIVGTVPIRTPQDSLVASTTTSGTRGQLVQRSQSNTSFPFPTSRPRPPTSPPRAPPPAGSPHQTSQEPIYQ